MTIPVSRLVTVSPSTLEAATGVNFFNGLVLTRTLLQPGELRAYEDAASVAHDFSATAPESAMAAAYFAGYNGARRTPQKLYFYGAAPAPTDDTHTSGHTLAQAPGDLLNALVAQTQDFVGFATAWEPTDAEKQAIAQWVGGMEDRYWYVAWDTNPAALTAPADNTSNNAPACFGAWLKAQDGHGTGLSGTTVVWHDPALAGFCLGWAASLDFSATDGRTNLAGRSSPVLTGAEGSTTDYDALTANGYCVYGAFGNGLGRWNLLENGAVSGPFKWADSYINQVWLNAALQGALLLLLTNAQTVPYNAEGDGMMSAAVADIRAQARNFGAVRSGVALTALQQASLQRLFGHDVSADLFNSGDCFQPNASSAPADVRESRQSPPALYAWCDGQSIQSIHLSSLQVQ